MTGCRKWFSELDETMTGKVNFGDGSMVDIKGKGTVLFQCQTGEHRLLSWVYFIPGLCSNIISLGQLDEHGCKTVIEGGLLSAYDSSRRLLAKVRRSRGRLYILQLQTVFLVCTVCLLRNIGEETWLWHARFGHLNFQALKKLSQGRMVIGMPTVDYITQLCDGCVLAKHHRMPFPHSTSFQADWRL